VTPIALTEYQRQAVTEFQACFPEEGWTFHVERHAPEEDAIVGTSPAIAAHADWRGMPGYVVLSEAMCERMYGHRRPGLVYENTMLAHAARQFKEAVKEKS
jgi:hypothetical protein